MVGAWLGLMLKKRLRFWSSWQLNMNRGQKLSSTSHEKPLAALNEFMSFKDFFSKRPHLQKQQYQVETLIILLPDGTCYLGSTTYISILVCTCACIAQLTSTIQRYFLVKNATLNTISILLNWTEVVNEFCWWQQQGVHKFFSLIKIDGFSLQIK